MLPGRHASAATGPEPFSSCSRNRRAHGALQPSAVIPYRPARRGDDEARLEAIGNIIVKKEALDCELRYVFIPKRSLEKILSERAKKLYEYDQKRLEHQMRLEGQGTKTDTRRALEVAMLVINQDKRLWDDL